MCFSATASFTASALLAGAGVATLVKVRNTSASLFAGSALLFSLQQFVEGILWLGFNDRINPHWVSVATFAFLFIAQVIWPVWVPLSMYRMEYRQSFHRILKVLIICGIVYAVHAFYSLIYYQPTAQVADHHILYHLNFPVMLIHHFSTVIYFATTVLPFFVTSMNRMRAFGLAIFSAFVVTYILYPDFVISIWCYYAAVLSALVYFVVKDIPLSYGRPSTERQRN